MFACSRVKSRKHRAAYELKTARVDTLTPSMRRRLSIVYAVDRTVALLVVNEPVVAIAPSLRSISSKENG
jgi:hypothetical protein